jgi:general secretion pathway protein E
MTPAEMPTPAELARVTRLHDALTLEYLEQYGVLPLRVADEHVLIATWYDTIQDCVQDDLAIAFARPVQLVTMPEEPLRAAMHRAYAEESRSAEDVIAGLSEDVATVEVGDPALDDLVHLANEAPVVRLVNLLLLEALEARASDVHIEAYAGGVRVRYRVDGVLQDGPSPPASMRPAIVSRIKIMADLDIAERRQPQDGRIRLRLQQRDVDVRVSTLPTLHGESVVLRLLDKESGRIGLEDIGMAPDTLARFVEAISLAHGIVLATGPTGSGKTTTLYAAIDRIRTGREKILAVEDPVEYELAGVPQVQVHEKAGVTFASALRALLRQDPDVMLVGEIRDAETAEIATHAALTGHLVLSTLHTNDAATALTRLIDLGVAPYLVTSTVEAVLAQRLVRRICSSCRREGPPDPAKLRALGMDPATVPFVWEGAGCDVCRGTGYRGRSGIYELLLPSPAFRELALQQRGARELQQQAIAEGMRSLREDGVRQILAGHTTTDEVLRVTRA